MIIQGGTGNGYSAEVSEENRLQVDAYMKTKFAVASAVHGWAYSWTAVSADVAAGVGGIYLVNTSTTKNLFIESVFLFADVPNQFKIWCPATYTAPDGTAIVGLNLNRTSGNAAEASCTANETNNAFAAAQTILTVRNNEATADEFGLSVDFHGALILGYHDAVEVELVADTAAFECTIFGYFHD